MMSNIQQRLLDKLNRRKELGTLRDLKHVNGLVDFSSNDYLGLAHNTELNALIKAEQAEVLAHGATGSRLLTGNSQLTEEFEAMMAQHFNGESALFFNSGYQANLAVASTLPQRGDTIIYDSAIHACIKEGARLSAAKYYSFQHNDLIDLEQKLKLAKGQPIVIIESIYSMDGDWADVQKVVDLCKQYQAALIIDEAHSTGWIGDGGNGLVCSLKLEHEFLARVYTFGKAIGCHGACVVGDETVIKYLINFARPFIYTTALPDTIIKGLQCTWDYLREHSNLSQQLQSNIDLYLKQRSHAPGVNQQSPIQWIPAPGNQNALNYSRLFQEHGLDVRPILSPTVKEGTERLRICLHSFNTGEQIEKLVEVIEHSVL